MKYLILFIAVLLFACGTQSNKGSAEVTEKNDNAEYEATMDSARAIVGQFIELMKAEKYEEALDFYLKDKGVFFVAFELTTDNFKFHNDFIIPMLFEYKDREIAYKETIRILEMNQLLAEAVILFSEGDNIPVHYGTLLYELGNLYIETEHYEEALALTDKMLEHFVDEQALIYYNKAFVYKLIRDNAGALKSAEKAISILKELKQQDSKLYNDCLEIIADVKGKSKKK